MTEAALGEAISKSVALASGAGTTNDSHLLFQRLSCCLPDAAFVASDRRGVIVDATPQLAAILGIPISSVLHRHSDVFLHPDDRLIVHAGAKERRGTLSHSKVIRLRAGNGWRRVEAKFVVAEDTSVVAHIRRLRFSSDAGIHRGLDHLNLLLRGRSRLGSSQRLHGVLSTVCDLIGWSSSTLSQLSSDGRPEVIAAAHASSNNELASLLASTDLDSELRLALEQGSPSRPQARFSLAVGPAASGVTLQLRNDDPFALLSGRQRLVVASVVNSLVESWELWNDHPRFSSPLPRTDHATGLASRLALIDSVDDRLNSSARSGVALFRIGLSGLQKVRNERNDDAANHIMVSVAHAIRFVLDDATIAQTGEDELSAVTSDLGPSEDPTQLAGDLLHEIHESFSWRFGVTPFVAVATQRQAKDDAASLLQVSQLRLGQLRSRQPSTGQQSTGQQSTGQQSTA